MLTLTKRSNERCYVECHTEGAAEIGKGAFERIVSLGGDGLRALVGVLTAKKDEVCCWAKMPVVGISSDILRHRRIHIEDSTSVISKFKGSPSQEIVWRPLMNS